MSHTSSLQPSSRHAAAEQAPQPDVTVSGAGRPRAVNPPRLLSVNLAVVGSIDVHPGSTGIDKRPVDGPVRISAPGPKGTGRTGLVGDRVCDVRHHGGDDQAGYAYAREDLDQWATDLGRYLPNGVFGENFTTVGVEVTGARVGERWRIGDEVVLQVTSPRIPCRTFARWLDERGWIRRFTERGVPGAYLRVVRPGEVRVGDPVTVVHRPSHDVTIGLVFRALTTDPQLLPDLLAAGDDLTTGVRDRAERHEPFDLG